jgi:hypothetical protein
MFIESKTCIYSTAPQLSEEWKRLRIGSLSASKITSLIGDSPFSKSPEESALECLGLTKPIFTKEAQARMKIGTDNEGLVREWYSKRIGIPIRELGLAIWKENPIFRSSLDGIYTIGDQNVGLEIKITDSMYKPLLLHHHSHHPKLNDVMNDEPQRKNNHIWLSHYDQMIQNMAISGLDRMDYVVVDWKTNQVYIEEVYPNNEQWKLLVEKGTKFYNRYVLPLSEQTGIKRYDPPYFNKEFECPKNG